MRCGSNGDYLKPFHRNKKKIDTSQSCALGSLREGGPRREGGRERGGGGGEGCPRREGGSERGSEGAREGAREGGRGGGREHLGTPGTRGGELAATAGLPSSWLDGERTS
jgi:hypothetical protein